MANKLRHNLAATDSTRKIGRVRKQVVNVNICRRNSFVLNIIGRARRWRTYTSAQIKGGNCKDNIELKMYICTDYEEEKN